MLVQERVHRDAVEDRDVRDDGDGAAESSGPCRRRERGGPRPRDGDNYRHENARHADPDRPRRERDQQPAEAAHTRADPDVDDSRGAPRRVEVAEIVEREIRRRATGRREDHVRGSGEGGAGRHAAGNCERSSPQPHERRQRQERHRGDRCERDPDRLRARDERPPRDDRRDAQRLRAAPDAYASTRQPCRPGREHDVRVQDPGCLTDHRRQADEQCPRQREPGSLGQLEHEPERQVREQPREQRRHEPAQREPHLRRVGDTPRREDGDVVRRRIPGRAAHVARRDRSAALCGRREQPPKAGRERPARIARAEQVETGGLQRARELRRRTGPILAEKDEPAVRELTRIPVVRRLVGTLPRRQHRPPCNPTKDRGGDDQPERDPDRYP